MAISDFFRINFPYGITRNEKGEWLAFNREYMPLGWNDTNQKESIFQNNVYGSMPVYTKYKGLTETKLEKLAENPDSVSRDEKGKINRVFFYMDATNPQTNPKHWDRYFEKVKLLSSLERSNDL